MEEQEAAVPPRYSCKQQFALIFSHVEVHIKIQQTYNSNGLYAHKSYISNNLKGAISEYEGVSDCEGNDYEEFPH